MAASSPPQGAGVVAAGVVALAAALCESLARGSLPTWPDARGAAVQAASLRTRAEQAAIANAHAYAIARDALALRAERQGTGRDGALRAALIVSADTLLSIADAGADCAGLAAEIARHCEPELRADAAGAAELGVAAARVAAGLVEVNLALLPGDARRTRARAIVAGAEAERDRATEQAHNG